MQRFITRLKNQKRKEVVAESDVAAAQREDEVLDRMLDDQDVAKSAAKSKKVAAFDRIRALMLKLQQPEWDVELDEKEKQEERQAAQLEARGPSIRRHAAMRMVNKQRSARLVGQTEMRLNFSNTRHSVEDLERSEEGTASLSQPTTQSPKASTRQPSSVQDNDEDTTGFDELPNDEMWGPRSPTRAQSQSHNPTMHAQATRRDGWEPPAAVGGDHRRFFCTARIAAQKAAPDSKTPASTPQTTKEELPNGLTHVGPSGAAHMVSISSKDITSRSATAINRITFSKPTTHALITENLVKKGDVLSVARIAGIMAAKSTPQLIPLCHPISLSYVGVELKVFGPSPHAVGSHDAGLRPNGGENGGVWIEATCECAGQTGVEMEALTAATVAGLTVYDMCKAVDKGMGLGMAMVVRKTGGKSGDWAVEGWQGLEGSGRGG